MRGHRNWLLAILGSLALGMALSAGSVASEPAQAQAAPQNSPGTAGQETAVDDLQRSFRIDTYQLLAKEGAARGQSIYKNICWVCHHQFQKDAPDLKDLYKRQNLLSGDAVSDAAISAQIKNGGPGMPSFRTTLSDRDVADVVSYLRGGSCCREEQNPAANPWYRAPAQKWPVQNGLSGGARGVVRTAKGELLEGVAVQMIAQNGVRTTVYTNDRGDFEFPAMQGGRTPCGSQRPGKSSLTGETPYELRVPRS